jgi:hypothetical protein
MSSLQTKPALKPHFSHSAISFLARLTVWLAGLIEWLEVVSEASVTASTTVVRQEGQSTHAWGHNGVKYVSLTSKAPIAITFSETKAMTNDQWVRDQRGQPWPQTTNRVCVAL